MKKLSLFSLICVLSLSLTACPGKDKGGKSVAATPKNEECKWDSAYNNGYGAYRLPNGNRCTPVHPDSQDSCNNYRYDWRDERFVDFNGDARDCTNGYFNFGGNRAVLPFFWINDIGRYVRGCKGYEALTGFRYKKVNLGAGPVCVRKDLLPFAFQQRYWGTYGAAYVPTACVVGVNCRASCGGVGGSVSLGPLYLGGTLAFCSAY